MNNNCITSINIRSLHSFANCPSKNRQCISFERKPITTPLEKDQLDITPQEPSKPKDTKKKQLINISSKRKCSLKSVLKLFLGMGLATVGTIMNANRVLPRYGYILTNGGISTISKDQQAYNNIKTQLALLKEHPYGKKIMEVAEKEGMPKIVLVDSFQLGDYQALQVGNYLVLLKDSPITPGLIAHELIHKITQKDGISLLEEQVVAEIQNRIDFDIEHKTESKINRVTFKVGSPPNSVKTLPSSACSLLSPEENRDNTAQDYNTSLLKKWYLSRDNHMFDTLDKYGLTPLFRTPLVVNEKPEPTRKINQVYYLVETPFNEQQKDLPKPESIEELDSKWTLLPGRRNK